MDLGQYTAMATIVNRAVEWFKKAILDLWYPAILDDKKRDTIRSVILLLLSGGLGFLIVFGAGPAYNLFLGSEVYGKVNPVFGQFLTGMFIGGGANALNWIGSFLWGWRTSPSPGATVSVSTPPGTSGSAEVSVGSPPAAL